MVVIFNKCIFSDVSGTRMEVVREKMQWFPFGVCSAFIPPCSGCVSPWESGCDAFKYEIFHISSGGERERNTDKKFLVKVKYHGPIQVQVFFLFFVNLLHWWLMALAVRPLADLGQTHNKRGVKWPASSQKAECLIPKKFLLFRLKTVFFPKVSFLAV